MNDTEKRKKIDYTSSPQQSLGYIIIGIGVVWLLVSLLGLPLWPLLLLGIGVLMLTGNLRPGDVQHHHFSAPIAKAESAEVHLNLEMGETVIHALSDETALFDAELAHLGDVAFSVSGEQHQIVDLKHAENFHFRWLNPANWLSFLDDLSWDIGLNSTLPTQLYINGGVGKTALNLGDLNLTGLDVKTGMGEVDLTLPAPNKSYDASLKGGMGEFKINISDGAALNLDIHGGMGEFKIKTPKNSAVHIQSKMGIGEVNASARFTNVVDDTYGVGGSGTWKTEGFDSVERKIFIRFNTGLGALNVE